MEIKRYTITELELLSGLPRRTIHFYVSQKLLPAPDSRGGPGAKYDEGHLARLQLIKALQGHLRLDGIRQALEAMTTAEMQKLVSESVAGATTWDAAALTAWLAGDGRKEADTPVQGCRGNISFAAMGRKDTGGGGQEPNPLVTLRRNRLKGEEWRRFTVIDGVEVSIRGDVDPADAVRSIRRLLEQLQRRR